MLGMETVNVQFILVSKFTSSSGVVVFTKILIGTDIYEYFSGAYDDEEAAARAYDLAALKYWGTSTFTNFPV